MVGPIIGCHSDRGEGAVSIALCPAMSSRMLHQWGFNGVL